MLGFAILMNGMQMMSGAVSPLPHGLLTKPTQGEALEFAVAASALKHTVSGRCV